MAKCAAGTTGQQHPDSSLQVVLVSEVGSQNEATLGEYICRRGCSPQLLPQLPDTPMMAQGAVTIHQHGYLRGIVPPQCRGQL
jgi:hypothetical protein